MFVPIVRSQRRAMDPDWRSSENASRCVLGGGRDLERRLLNLDVHMQVLEYQRERIEAHASGLHQHHNVCVCWREGVRVSLCVCVLLKR
jgi:hypothetical protein